MMNQLLQKYFGFDPAKTTVRTEIIAGVSTFLTMAYILAVNPAILGITGMDKGALFATTAITSGIATLIMALYAKMPFGLAPGMGINAFFAYTVCLSMGHTWQFALTAVLLKTKERFRELTEREKQIVLLLTKGLLNREVGERLGISTRTVEVHRARAFKKLELHTISELIQFVHAAEG